MALSNEYETCGFVKNYTRSTRTYNLHGQFSASSYYTICTLHSITQWPAANQFLLYTAHIIPHY